MPSGPPRLLADGGLNPNLQSYEVIMKDGLWVIGVFVVWFVLQVWVLSKLGIST